MFAIRKKVYTLQLLKCNVFTFNSNLHLFYIMMRCSARRLVLRLLTIALLRHRSACHIRWAQVVCQGPFYADKWAWTANPRPITRNSYAGRRTLISQTPVQLLASAGIWTRVHVSDSALILQLHCRGVHVLYINYISNLYVVQLFMVSYDSYYL